MRFWGSTGSGVGGGGILIVNIMKRTAGKLRRIILLHFGLVTFRDVTMTPKPIILHLGGTHIFKKIQEVPTSFSRNIILGNMRISKLENREDVLPKFLFESQY